jgi:glycine dehydrogenase subunit 2
MVELEEALAEITGMSAVSLQPAAGAHGELLGMMVARQFHLANGDGHRNRVLIPDSAHGTNPASAALVGFATTSVKTGDDGCLDIPDLQKKLGADVVGLMLTNPNTLGLFERGIEEIAALVHASGGLMYMDGANMNAILGQCRPGDMGFDMVHLNLHKTFSTPHGGGGPGCGPLCVVDRLQPYLPYPRPVRDGERYAWLDAPKDGTVHQRIHGTFGNFGMMVRALAYILRNGGDGLARVGEMAVLNANYLKVKLQGAYPIDHSEGTLHEFVASGREFKKHGVRTLDIAKRLLDLGYHAPTIYFPLVVDEALMIEPTETESMQTLDAFAEAMLQIKREAQEDPEILKQAPTTTPVRRLDETKANRQPMVCWGGHC